MTKTDVYLSIALSITVLALFIFFYNKLFAITFDETFARAGGIKTGVYNMLIAFLTAVTIVLGMRMMGAMLISSLIIFPALSAMRVFKKFKTVTVCSCVVSIACFFTGVVISYLYAMPTGASVVMVNIIAFILFWAAGALPRRRTTMKAVIASSFVLMFIAAGCGADSARVAKAASLAENVNGGAVEKKAAKSGAKAGGDSLVEIKEKMFIAQVNDVYSNPKDYLEKTIKLEGIFKIEQYPGIQKPYCFVIRYGPGCCGADGSAGFEVAWDKNAQKQYPSADSWVEAVGILKSMEEDGAPFIYLDLMSLNVMDKRGREFVNQ
jgi:uncharacterized membrane protein YcgQ (UPF0703/DUF1980 family)